MGYCSVTPGCVSPEVRHRLLFFQHPVLSPPPLPKLTTHALIRLFCYNGFGVNAALSLLHFSRQGIFPHIQLILNYWPSLETAIDASQSQSLLVLVTYLLFLKHLLLHVCT